jgi:hypothetical protein
MTFVPEGQAEVIVSPENGAMKATILGLRPLFYAPKGLQHSAQGFNPGNVHQERRALKGAPDRTS